MTAVPLGSTPLKPSVRMRGLRVSDLGSQDSHHPGSGSGWTSTVQSSRARVPTTGS